MDREMAFVKAQQFFVDRAEARFVHAAFGDQGLFQHAAHTAANQRANTVERDWIAPCEDQRMVQCDAQIL